MRLRFCFINEKLFVHKAVYSVGYGDNLFSVHLDNLICEMEVLENALSVTSFTP